jgi:hypothetical protein
MSPEDLAPAAPAPDPAPPPGAATPEPAPAPAPAPTPVLPEPTADAFGEAKPVDTDMWKSMLGALGGEAAPRDEARPKPEREPREPALPRETPPSPTRPAPPAPPAPKRWGGKYETPDALESAYGELERARDRAESERLRALEHAERIERLLAATMARPAAPAPPPGVDPQQWARQQAVDQARAAQPPQLQEALQLIQAEAERLALGDPQADPLRLVRAVAMASRLDAEARRSYGDLAVSEYQQQAQVEGALQSIQTKFFETYPDLKSARPSLLRQVAIETEDALRQSRRDYGSPAYMQAWFDETAKQARASIRTGDGTVSAPAAPSPSRSTSTPPARSARGAPFAETPAPRPQEPVLTGQDLHLARVFGRGA